MLYIKEQTDPFAFGFIKTDIIVNLKYLINIQEAYTKIMLIELIKNTEQTYTCIQIEGLFAYDRLRKKLYLVCVDDMVEVHAQLSTKIKQYKTN